MIPKVESGFRTRSCPNANKETRDPVTSPPLPVPDRIARGQLSPKSWPQLFQAGGAATWKRGVNPC
jgi:hypothetical protein